MTTAACMMASLLLVANADPADTFYIHHREFMIPIGIVNEARRADIKAIRLYLATPDGKSWEPINTATSDKEGFPFRAPADGPYVFKLAVVNARNKQEPEDISRDDKVKPRSIIVDTVPPVVRLLSAARLGGDEFLVRWEVQETNPDWATLKLEYRASDAAGSPWSRIPVESPSSGMATVRVSGPVVAVRLSMTDLAKNESNRAELPVENGAPGMGIAAVGGTSLPPLSADGTPAPLPPVDKGETSWSPTAAAPAPAVPPKSSVVASTGAGPPASAVTPPPARGPLPPAKMVRKRQVTIEYEVTKFGPSGIKSVELYVTRDDGRTWQRCDGEDNVPTSPTPDAHGLPPTLKRSLTVDLQADGLYGFYLVVKSGAGLGKPPPQNGIDLPQMRVEVDTTFPDAQLLEPRPHPTRRDSLILAWTARDNKLGDRPITLQWAERPDGDWQTIGGGELPNTGEFAWQVPANIPPHVYLKMLVRDLAGNESVAQTAQPVLVDLSEPEVKPIQISVSPH